MNTEEYIAKLIRDVVDMVCDRNNVLDPDARAEIACVSAHDITNYLDRIKGQQITAEARLHSIEHRIPPHHHK